MSTKDAELIFQKFELDALWERINDLKERDHSNASKVVRMYGFLILYASAPFYFQAFDRAGALMVWAFGGVWLASTVWLLSDLFFRGYGRHLKERMYCLTQIAVIRSIDMHANRAYKRYSLMPWGYLGRTLGAREGFPERIGQDHIDRMSYFFKFVSLFPALFLVFFLGTLALPEQFLAQAGTGGSGDLSTSRELFGLFARLTLAASAIPFLWLWAGSKRCMRLQRTVFTARRIHAGRPWPLYPSDKVRRRLGRWRKVSSTLLILGAAVVSFWNGYRGLSLISEGKVPNQAWEKCDLYLLAATVIIFLLGFAFTEIDIRLNLRAAQKLDPIEPAR